MATEITTATAETSLASTDYLLGYSPGTPDTFKRYGITALSAFSTLTPAADRLPYFTGASTASITTLTAAGRALLDDADADAQRTTLAAAGTGVANTFSVGPQVMVGGTTIRQSGGTPGTDEHQITRGASSLTIKSMDDGSTIFTDSSNNVRATLAVQFSGVLALATEMQIGSGNVGSVSRRFYASGLDLTAGDTVSWRSGNFGTVDTNLERAAAAVVSVGTSTTGHTLRSKPLAPAQITSNQNDYAPGVARFYRLSTDASRDITGLSISQVDGQEFEIWNVGSNDLVLKHQSASSTAANRFICTGAADITLAADEIALVRYDATTARFRVRKV